VYERTPTGGFDTNWDHISHIIVHKAIKDFMIQKKLSQAEKVHRNEIKHVFFDSTLKDDVNQADLKQP